MLLYSPARLLTFGARGALGDFGLLGAGDLDEVRLDLGDLVPGDGETADVRPFIWWLKFHQIKPFLCRILTNEPWTKMLCYFFFLPYHRTTHARARGRPPAVLGEKLKHGHSADLGRHSKYQPCFFLTMKSLVSVSSAIAFSSIGKPAAEPETQNWTCHRV